MSLFFNNSQAHVFDIAIESQNLNRDQIVLKFQKMGAEVSVDLVYAKFLICKTNKIQSIVRQKGVRFDFANTIQVPVEMMKRG